MWGKRNACTPVPTGGLFAALLARLIGPLRDEQTGVRILAVRLHQTANQRHMQRRHAFKDPGRLQFSNPQLAQRPMGKRG